MRTEAPVAGLDLLLVGGLAIDRLPDGSLAAGGSVLHAARAAAEAGWRVGAVVSAGDEPVAREAVSELEGLLAVLHVIPSARSIGFVHRASRGGRELTFAGSGGPLACEPLAVRPSAVLYAPIADELDADLAGQRYPAARSGAAIQGWLRWLEPNRPARPLPLDALAPALVERLSGLELLVASREDLARAGERPRDQLRALRAVVGPKPTLVVTDGTDGAWLDRGGPGQPEPPWHLPVRRRIDGVPTVGAGDVFAAGMLLGESAAPSTRAALTRRAEAAMELVARTLERRRPG